MKFLIREQLIVVGTSSVHRVINLNLYICFYVILRSNLVCLKHTTTPTGSKGLSAKAKIYNLK